MVSRKRRAAKITTDDATVAQNAASTSSASSPSGAFITVIHDILTAVSLGKKRRGGGGLSGMSDAEKEFIMGIEERCGEVLENGLGDNTAAAENTEAKGKGKGKEKAQDEEVKEEVTEEVKEEGEGEAEVEGGEAMDVDNDGNEKDLNEEPSASTSAPAAIAEASTTKRRRGAKAEKAPKPPKPEKRLKKWRDEPPKGVLDRIHRCNTQRMFVIGREPVEGSNPPEEVFQMAGSTGNVYTVRIGKKQKCNCPDGVISGTCKHVLYIMLKVLRARADLVYQLALTSEELVEIFANAPKAPSSSTPIQSKQKPLDADDCPICYYDFEPSQSIVFCSAMCGTNLHEQCFKEWEASKKSMGQQVTCVMCRTPWQKEIGDLARVVMKAGKGKEGYVNVGKELGLPSRRR